MKADKFQTAGRLAAALELNKPRDEREELRPLTPAQVREREFEEVKGKRDFQRWTADRYIWGALDRILNPIQCGRPTAFDANILLSMDDDDLASFAYSGDRDRLILFRDNLRQRLPS